MHNTDKAAVQLECALGLKKVLLVALSKPVKRNQDVDMLRELLPCRSTESESQPSIQGLVLGLPECSINN